MHLWINSFSSTCLKLEFLRSSCIFNSPPFICFYHFLPEKRKRCGDRRQVTNKKGNVTERRDFAPTTSLAKIRNTISYKEKLVQRIPYSLLDNVHATFPFFNFVVDAYERVIDTLSCYWLKNFKCLLIIINFEILSLVVIIIIIII